MIFNERERERERETETEERWSLRVVIFNVNSFIF